MSIETLLAENTAAIQSNTAVLERLLAGQELALAKIEPAKATKPAATPKPAAAEKPVEPTPTAAEVKAEAAVKSAPAVADADVKAAALAWMEGKSKEDRIAASAKLTELLTHFGTDGKLTGPESKLDDDQRKQAKFFIQRWAAGLTVDFGADYDFDGSPTQGAAEEEADPLG